MAVTLWGVMGTLATLRRHRVPTIAPVPKEEKVRTPLYLPASLKRKLVKIAKYEGRTLSGQIFVYLRRAVEDAEKDPSTLRAIESDDEEDEDEGE
jgi:hypothetical protein